MGWDLLHWRIQRVVTGCQVGRVEHRTHTPAETAEQYYRRNMAIPLIDHSLTESQSHFSEQAKRATNILKLFPSAIDVSRSLKGQ